MAGLRPAIYRPTAGRISAYGRQYIKDTLVRFYNIPSGTAQWLPDSVRSHFVEPHKCPRSSASLRISTEITVKDKDSLVRIYNCPSGTARCLWTPLRDYPKMAGRAAQCLRTRVPPDIPGKRRYRLRIALAVDTIAPPGQPDGSRTLSGRASAHAIPTSLASIRTGPAQWDLKGTKTARERFR